MYGELIGDTDAENLGAICGGDAVGRVFKHDRFLRRYIQPRKHFQKNGWVRLGFGYVVGGTNTIEVAD